MNSENKGKNKERKNKERENISTSCDMCAHYAYDELYGEYICEIDLDEDEMCRFLSSSNYACPYFNLYDEYKIVRKQN